DVRSGSALPGLGPRNLDSLVTAHSRTQGSLRAGATTEWIEFPYGLARLRVAEHEAPDPEQLAARIETQRRIESERRLQAYYEALKARYRVRILDRELRGVVLPPIPGSAALSDRP